MAPIVGDGHAAQEYVIVTTTTLCLEGPGTDAGNLFVPETRNDPGSRHAWNLPKLGTLTPNYLLT